MPPGLPGCGCTLVRHEYGTRCHERGCIGWIRCDSPGKCATTASRAAGAPCPPFADKYFAGDVGVRAFVTEKPVGPWCWACWSAAAAATRAAFAVVAAQAAQQALAWQAAAGVAALTVGEDKNEEMEEGEVEESEEEEEGGEETAVDGNHLPSFGSLPYR